LALLANLAPKWTSAALFAAYSSFCNVGGAFMSFQWDGLLLESTAQAAVIAPAALRPGLGREEPTGVAKALLRLLPLRLYLESGTAKWQSEDPTWRGYTATRHYYETAPLP